MDPPDLEGVARRHGIALLLRFGYTLSGRTHARSDVDLAVLLERPALTMAEHAHDLQRLFPDREVDLAIVNHADPLFLKKILERCELLHGSQRRLHELRILAFKRYQDHRRLLELERRYVDRTLGGTA